MTHSRPNSLGPVDAMYKVGVHDGHTELQATLIFLTTDELFEQRRLSEASARSVANAALAELDKPASAAERASLGSL